MAKEIIALLVTQLDECFFGGAWHGACLHQTLKGLTIEQALFESPDGLSAWSIALHCAYWKYRARKRLLDARGQAVGRFERSPANWPKLPAALDAEGWRADLAFLEGQHAALRAAVVKTSPSLLAQRYNSKGHSYHRLIAGVAAHDVYHTAHIRNIGIPGLT